MAAKYTSPPVPLPSLASLEESADWLVTVHGVDQAGPSFEARVFLNNPDADEETETSLENGYAGSFEVYGYGLSPSQKPSRLPMNRVVEATEAIRHELERGHKETTVTIVPILAPTGPSQTTELEERLGIESVEILPK
ncbi:MAG TPA: hypothetical protein VHE55_09130 [Fimbriimonadaceae bacterium]|nr:hypothetical protein [Fimbriimonadaceae bacterium]